MINWMNQTIKWIFCGCGSQQSKSVSRKHQFIREHLESLRSRSQMEQQSEEQWERTAFRRIYEGTESYSEADEVEQRKSRAIKELGSVQKKEKAFEAVAFEMQRDFCDKIPFVLIFLFLRQFYSTDSDTIFSSQRQSIFSRSIYRSKICVLFIQQNSPHLWENRSLRFSRNWGKNWKIELFFLKHSRFFYTLGDDFTRGDYFRQGLYIFQNNRKFIILWIKENIFEFSSCPFF